MAVIAFIIVGLNYQTVTARITVDNFDVVTVGLGLYVIGLGAIVTVIGVLRSMTYSPRPTICLTEPLRSA